MAKQMFDTIQNRLNYGELLQPDFGYNLEFAVGLTYSLDLEALLGVPISMGLLDEMDTSLRNNPFYMLEAIRKSSDKIAIFCNAGGISLPQNIQSVYSLLENSVFEVKLPNKQNFHPKLWFIKYTDNSLKSYIKLIVLSRNLTFDNSLDFAFELVGEIKNVTRNKNKPLFDMLNFVANFSNKTKKEKIISLANDVLHVKEFDIASPFEDYDFLPFGINGSDKVNTEMFDGNRDILVVSPFLSDDIVGKISKATGQKALITRKSSINQKTLNSFDSVYITNDFLIDNEYCPKQDIHAKLYFTNCDGGNHLYLGSANASHNAFYNNVEFLIKLKYAACMGSYKQIFDDLISQEKSPFVSIPSISDIEDIVVSEELSDAIKEVIWAIKGAKVIEKGGVYDVEVYASKLKADKDIRIAPLQRPLPLVPFEQTTVLKNILLKQLSDFYILMADGKKLVVKIETKNIPQGRDDAVYQDIINSKPAFLSYVSFMLSDNYWESAYEQAEYLKLLDKNSQNINGDDITAAVYEKMLKAVVKNPNRLKEIADVIRRLDKNVVGDEFLNMYKEFELAVRRLSK
jgi:HKD family nuclease